MSVQQHRIFVSHSHQDNEFGIRLVQDLQRVLDDESAVWYDAHGGLHGGDPWWRKIVQELESRNIFIVILSPDAMNSEWVNDEIDIAWQQKNSQARMHILPLLCRTCKVRADLTKLQIISFVPPNSYITAFQELLVALGLPMKEAIKPEGSGMNLQRQIERAFSEQDWPDVIRKVNYLLKYIPDAASGTIYHMQGLALLKEEQIQPAQEALETALALVEDKQQRLSVLSDYTGLLARQGRWDEVVQRTKEALRLVPNHPWWLAAQEQAKRKLQGAPAGIDNFKVPSQPFPARQWNNPGRKDILAIGLSIVLYLIVQGIVLLFVPGFQVLAVFVLPYVLGMVSLVLSKREGFSGLIPAFISGLAGGVIYFILNTTISSLSGITLQPSGIPALALSLLVYGFISLAGAAIYIGIKKLHLRLVKPVSEQH